MIVAGMREPLSFKGALWMDCAIKGHVIVGGVFLTDCKQYDFYCKSCLYLWQPKGQAFHQKVAVPY
jgi:hypothetical protein